MKAKSKPLGKSTSAEVTHISTQGIWLLVGDKEYLLPFAEYPWFAEAKVADINAVKLLHGSHLRWENLDVDLELASLDNPMGYPLAYRA